MSTDPRLEAAASAPHDRCASFVDRVTATLGELGYVVTSTLVASVDGYPGELARVEVTHPDGGSSVLELPYLTRGGDDLFLRDVEDPEAQASRERLRRAGVLREIANSEDHFREGPAVTNAEYARLVTAVRATPEPGRRLAMSSLDEWPGDPDLAERRDSCYRALASGAIRPEHFPLALAFVEDLAAGTPLKWALRRHDLGAERVAP